MEPGAAPRLNQSSSCTVLVGWSTLPRPYADLGHTANRLSRQPPPRAVASSSVLTGPFYAFDAVILLSSARTGISSKSSSLRRVQSMPVGAALGRLMRMVWVGVAITLSG